MLRWSSLLEREMRNKSGPNSSGNLRHFHKTILSPPAQKLGRKIGSGFSPTHFLHIQFGFLLIISLVSSVQADSMIQNKGNVAHGQRNTKLRHAMTKMSYKKCLVLRWVKVKQDYSRRHLCYGQEIVGGDICKVLSHCPGV